MNDKEDEIYEWVSFPARERVKTTVILTAFLILLFLGIWFTFKSFLILLLSIVILSVSLWSYYTPKWYKLNGEGVEVRTLITKRFKPWNYFHSYYWDKRGVQLSTFTYPSRLDPFRGLSLMFGGDNREEVIEFIGKYLDVAEERRKSRNK